MVGRLLAPMVAVEEAEVVVEEVVAVVLDLETEGFSVGKGYSS